MIMHVEEKDFSDVIKEGIVIVDFYAIWCGPCKMLTPMLETFSNLRSDIKIVKIDVDAQPELAKMFDVMSIPTLLLYNDGRLISTKQGFMTVDMLNEWVSQIK